MYDEEEMNLDEFENYLTKSMTRAKRRRTDRSKALSKARKASYIYRMSRSYYDNLHQYSKNKIYCSCPMCAAKTNTKIYKSKGPIGYVFHRVIKINDLTIIREMPRGSSRISMTCRRRGKKNYKHSDLRRMDRMQQQLSEVSSDATNNI